MPEALRFVENLEVAALIRACLAPAASRPSIDAIINHPVMRDNAEPTLIDLIGEQAPLQQEPSNDIIELK